MHTFLPELSTLVTTLKPYWLEYYPNETEQVFQQMESKLQAEQLSIQVYGAYNAGKSTLINVLLGEERAETGEIPTTDRIDIYDWQGYQLLDSPGVNAPIAHEQTSLAALKQNDLILMVIRQDDQDAKDIYERLFACLEEGKQIFIILNYNGLDPNKKGEGGVSLLMDQIYTILLDRAESKDISVEYLQAHVKVLPMQLASALKARQENKALLLSRSGYVEFIHQFEAWVKAYDDEQHFVASITRYLQQHLIVPLLEKCTVETQAESQQIAQAVQQLHLQRDNLIAASMTEARSLVFAQKPKLLQAVQQSETESALQQQLNLIFQTVYQTLNQWVQEHSEQANLSLMQQNVTHTAQPVNKPSENAHEAIDLGVDALKQFNNTDNLKQGLLQLRALKVPFIKGRWESTLSGWAGKAVPFLQVGFALYDLYRENSLQTERNQQQASQALQVHQLVDNISHDVLSQISDDLKKTFYTLFEAPLRLQTEQQHQHNKTVTQREQDYQSISLLAQDLEHFTLA